MTVKIHSDDAFILWNEQEDLLHVYLLANKQNLFFKCLYYCFTWFAWGLEMPTSGPRKSL